MVTETKMAVAMNVRDLAQAIVDNDCNGWIYTNDAGSGCGGPSHLTADELGAMIASGEIDAYTITDDPDTIVADTLWAHGVTVDDTPYILAIRDDDTGDNPYRHYLLLWSVAVD